MKFRTTFILLLLAGLLFAFIAHQERSRDVPVPDGLLTGDFDADKVMQIELSDTHLLMKVERQGRDWRISHPIDYPANPAVLELLLREMMDLPRQPLIGETNLPSVMAQFGLAPPRLSLKLTTSDFLQHALNFGSETVSGGQVYLNAWGQPGIYLGKKGLFDLLSQPLDIWRDRTFLDFTRHDYDGVRIQNGNRSFTVWLDRANRIWNIVEPLKAPGDTTKIDFLLQDLATLPVSRFVPAGPSTNQVDFGLTPPATSVFFLQGTNRLVQVDFGASPPDEPELAYARHSEGSNVFLVVRTVVDRFKLPYREFRDRQLLSLSLDKVDEIEVAAVGKFVLKKRPDSGWQVVSPESFRADPRLVQEFLQNLARMKVVRFDKDVVTDFTPFGLASPLRSYLLKTAGATNGLAARVVADVRFGTNDVEQPDLVYARRNQEDAVVSVSYAESLELPREAYQLRDRGLWRFGVTNLVRATITQPGVERQILRKGTNDWSLASASAEEINPFGIEEALHRLGRTRVVSWKGQGDSVAGSFGLNEAPYRLTLEFTPESSLPTLEMVFGKRSPDGDRYTRVTREGEPLVFTLEKSVFENLEAYLFQPQPSNPAKDEGQPQ